jgi:hypothetical protein
MAIAALYVCLRYIYDNRIYIYLGLCIDEINSLIAVEPRFGLEGTFSSTNAKQPN